MLWGKKFVGLSKFCQNMVLESTFSLTDRVVSLWNSLPNFVVDSAYINCFKSRLDQFWNSQDVLYNCRESDFTGTLLGICLHLL